MQRFFRQQMFGGIRSVFLITVVGVFILCITVISARALNDGGTIVFIKPVRAVIFEHYIHLDQNITCNTCHPALFKKKAGTLEEQADFTMQSFDEGKYCGHCHDGKQAFSANSNCTWCHIGVVGHKRLEERSLQKK